MLALALSPLVSSPARSQGHDPRFSAAYSRYAAVVRGALAQVGVPEADRDDLAQEVFVLLLRQLPQHAEGFESGGLRGWLYQVSRRIAANHRRAMRRRRRREDAVAGLMDGHERPIRDAVVDATVFLTRFLEQLDDDARAVFLLSEFEGRSGPEIAERLGINVNTAYARVRSVRARLQHAARDERHAGWLALLPVALPHAPPGLASGLAALAGFIARISTRKLLVGAALLLLGGSLLWLGLRGGRSVRGPEGGSPAPELADRSPDRSDPGESDGDDEHDDRMVHRGGGSIAGRVATAAGDAVSGARVCIEPRRRTLGVHVPRCVDADRGGGFVFDGLAAGVHGVAAAAPGHVEVVLAEAQQRIRIAPGQHRTGVDLRLRAGGALVRGTVVDVTGGPIEAAIVRPGGSITATFTRSDVDGRFELWVDGTSTPELVAEADGYAAASTALAWPGVRDLLFTLTPEATIDGIVVDEGGVGVPDVAVLAGATLMAEYQSTADLPTALTDEAGRFRLRALEPGRHHPLVQDDEWNGVATGPVVLGIGEVATGVTIHVRRARRLHGRVQREDGSACAGARVVVRDAVGEPIDSTRSDGDGELEFGGLPPEPVALAIDCHGAPPVRVELDLRAASLLEQTWIVTPRAGVAVRGRLLDPQGGPLALATVILRRGEPAADGNDVSDFGYTDAQGHFELGPLPSGSYTTRLRADGYARELEPRSFSIAGEAVELELHASAVGRLRVRTVDDSGTPVPEVDVSYRRTTGAGGFASSGADGVAVLELDPGSYRIREAAIGEAGMPLAADAFVDAQGIEVAGGEEEFTLIVGRRDGIVRGRVIDEDGSPVGDARIHVFAAEERRGWSGEVERRRVRDGWADDAGAFSIERLPAGRYLVGAATPGGVAGAAVPAMPGEPVTVVLPRSGSLCGTVMVDEDEVPRRFQISVRTADERRVQQRFDTADGAWCVEDLARGPATVEVATVVGTASATAEVPDGGITQGVELRLGARGHLVGRVVDLEGRPLAGAFIALHSAAGGLHSTLDGAREHSATDGTFDVAGPAGAIEVVVYGPGDFETRTLSATLRSGEPTAFGDVALTRR